MCGLAGVFIDRPSDVNGRKIKKALRILIKGTQRRGQDSSGFLIFDNHSWGCNKLNGGISNNLKTITQTFSLHLRKNQAFGLLMHSRMETHGKSTNQNNIHPISRNGLQLFHNGIILNHQDIVNNSGLIPSSDTDSEAFLILLELNSVKYPSSDSYNHFRSALGQVSGANSFVLYDSYEQAVNLSSKNGSLYFFTKEGVTFYASEAHVLSLVLVALGWRLKIEQIKNNYFLVANLDKNTFSLSRHTLPSTSNAFDIKTMQEKTNFSSTQRKFEWVREIQDLVDQKTRHQRSCIACLLPDSYPFIEFDVSGVCSICTESRQRKVSKLSSPKQPAELESKFVIGKNILVPFSGGKDSAFVLHILKNVLDLDVRAFTYDWGFVSDVGRRNISRICGELEIEHLLISANMMKKRENVSKNVRAWLNRPHPGIIPLFMAGDKAFFYHAAKLKREYGFDSVIFGMHRNEPASFKTGVMGIKEIPGSEDKTYGLSTKSRLSMIAFFARESILNPKLINGSMWDTLSGFRDYYLSPLKYSNFYDHYSWNLESINSIMDNLHGWEGVNSPMWGWRNGDATAPFYNVLYNLLLGYNENDVYISNLLRDGQVKFKDGVEMLMRQRILDVDNLQNYFDLIQIDSSYFFSKLKQNLKLFSLIQ